MAKKPVSIIHNKEWHKEVDFGLAILVIILFGSAVAYIMINAVK